MFVVTEEDAAAVRAVYEQRGEFAAAIELRRLEAAAAAAGEAGAAVTTDALTRACCLARQSRDTGVSPCRARVKIYLE